MDRGAGRGTIICDDITPIGFYITCGMVKISDNSIRSLVGVEIVPTEISVRSGTGAHRHSEFAALTRSEVHGKFQSMHILHTILIKGSISLTLVMTEIDISFRDSICRSSRSSIGFKVGNLVEF